MRRGSSTMALLALLVCAAPVWAGSARPINMVPADEPALAVMLSIARGASQPVLLVDPSDRASLDSFRAEWPGPVHCFRRPDTRRSVVALMRDAAGEACRVVDDLARFARTLWPEGRIAVATVVETGEKSKTGQGGTTGERNYPWLLRAAAFAGATGMALLPLPDEAPESTTALDGWNVLYLAPTAAAWRSLARQEIPNVIEIDSPESLLTEQLKKADVNRSVVVVANPTDRDGVFSPSALSLLAPLVATAHRAPLLLTSDVEADAIEREVLAILERQELSPSHVILVGDEMAMRSHRVEDPVAAAGGPDALGGSNEVRVEIFSEIQHQRPQDLVVGRLVAEGVGQGSAMLARQYHRVRHDRRSVVFFTNADQVFPLGEVISRTTAAEFRNVGVPVRAYYADEITDELVHDALMETDLLVWEGHARDLTLEERGGVAVIGAPEIVVLQGCHTFDRSDPFILMEKGTVAILGTSTAVYSAPGSALSRAFFDALLYDRVDLGTAARNARNFLLALAVLQRDRGHTDWRKTYRAALAFALWGDPTLVPHMNPRRPTVTPVRWAVDGAGLSLNIPRGRLAAASVATYRARPPSRAMLGGLLLREDDSEKRLVKELYYTVQDATDEPMTVCSPGVGWDVVSLYAPRTQTMTVLARPDWTMIEAGASRRRFTFPLASVPAACPVAAEQGT